VSDERYDARVTVYVTNRVTRGGDLQRASQHHTTVLTRSLSRATLTQAALRAFECEPSQAIAFEVRADWRDPCAVAPPAFTVYISAYL